MTNKLQLVMKQPTNTLRLYPKVSQIMGELSVDPSSIKIISKFA